MGIAISIVKKSEKEKSLELVMLRCHKWYNFVLRGNWNCEIKIIKCFEWHIKARIDD